jgi:hypothetical protein
MQAKKLELKVLAFQLKQVLLHEQTREQELPYRVEMR